MANHFVANSNQVMNRRPCWSDIYQKLHLAIEASNVQAVEELLQSCKELPQKEGLSQCLCEAVQHVNIDISKLLLKARADIRYVSSDGKRPLHYAALTGSLEMVKLILGAGSPVNMADSSGKTAMHLAVETGNTSIVQYLIQEGANVSRSRCYVDGESPLHVAAKMGKLEITRVLLARGGYLNVKSRTESTPLHMATKGKHCGVVSLLCDNNAGLEEHNEKGQTALLIAVEITSLELVKILLTNGANANARDMRGRSGMHYLGMGLPSSEANLEMAKLLLAAGMEDPNLEDVDRYTPLHYAAFKGNVQMVKLLLDMGVEINKHYVWRLDTPLNMAISNKQVEMVKLLIDRGVDATIVDGPHTQVTPLHKVMVTRIVKQEDKLAIVDLLLSHGAKLNVQTARENTPLADCVFFSAFTRDANLLVMMRLVSAGAKLSQPIHARTDPKNSPLCWLTWQGSLQAAKFLVSAGWELQHESWIWLPGKDEEMAKFLVWLQELIRKPKSLKQLCRAFIRDHLVDKCSGDSDIVTYVAELPLPPVIKRFLMLVPEISEYSPIPINVGI